MRWAAISAAAMCASGLAGVLMPDDVGRALELVPDTARARTEVRAGLGGTYAALGAWSLLSRSPAAKRAVGVTWLGAGLTRIGSLSADRPRTDAAFWAYLAVELGLGVGALGDARAAGKRG